MPSTIKKFPSAEEIVSEAKAHKPHDLNELHAITFGVMKKHRQNYYGEKVDAFLESTDLNEKQRRELREKMLATVKVEDKEYSNFMEEASRRISQTFQVISGNIAELCIEEALTNAGLKKGINYLRKKERTDFTFYYPDFQNHKKLHRLEVKNVKLRERGARGLAFDGDSMAGFFDDANEFTKDNIRVIEEHCKKTGGYCYLPPLTLTKIAHHTALFRSNLLIPKDFKYFTEKGVLP